VLIDAVQPDIHQSEEGGQHVTRIHNYISTLQKQVLNA
jgi:hypothetical protein